MKAKAYNIYVKPILNYASSIWNPVNNQYKVQRKAARLVTSDWPWNSSPSKTIGALGWNSIELLRKLSSLVILHKIVNGQIALAQDLLTKFSRGSSSNFQQAVSYTHLTLPTIYSV